MTDDVLSRAFQRYVHHGMRRHISSVPGPMYHRKRFGRRQMTELNSLQCMGALPVWALPNAPDMTKWQWQPPKPELWSPPRVETLPEAQPAQAAEPPDIHVHDEKPKPCSPRRSEALPELQSAQAVEPPDIYSHEESTVMWPPALLVAFPELQPAQTTNSEPPFTHIRDERAEQLAEKRTTEEENQEVMAQKDTGDIETASISISLRSLPPWVDLARDMRRMVATSPTATDYEACFKDWVDRVYEPLSQGQFTGSSVANLFVLARNSLQSAIRLWPDLAFQDISLHLLDAVYKGTRQASSVDRSFLIPYPWFWEAALKLWIASQNSFNDCNMSLFVTAMRKAKLRIRSRDHEVTLTALHKFIATWKGCEINAWATSWDHRAISVSAQLASMWSGRAKALMLAAWSKLQAGEIGRGVHAAQLAARCLARAERFVSKMAHLMSFDATVARYLAMALSRKSLIIDRGIFVRATHLLGPPRRSWSRAHYTWLQVMAGMPKVDSPRLKGLLSLFATRGHTALSHEEICELLLLHWQSQGKLHRYELVHTLWRDMVNKRLPVVASLAFAVNKTHSPIESTAIFWDLWYFLSTRIGRKPFIRQLASLGSARALPPKFLQRLAWTSKDHRIALLLHEILCRNQGKGCRFWWPPFWAKIVEEYSRRWKYSLIDPLQLANRLTSPDPTHTGRINPRLADKQIDPDFHKDLQAARTVTTPQAFVDELSDAQEYGRDQAMIANVKRSLRLVGNARQITDRQAVRYVTIFTSLLANKQGFLTARDLSTLTAIIMRTLDRGQYGSTERFRWYLGVIHRHLGEKACIKVGLILKERRQDNWEAWEAGLSRMQAQRQARAIARARQRRHLPTLWWSFVNKNYRQERKRRRLDRALREAAWAKGQIVSLRPTKRTTRWNAPVPNRFLGPTRSGKTIASKPRRTVDYGLKLEHPPEESARAPRVVPKTQSRVQISARAKRSNDKVDSFAQMQDRAVTDKAHSGNASF